VKTINATVVFVLMFVTVCATAQTPPVDEGEATRLIDVQLEQVEVAEAMQILSDATGFNVLVSNKVTGTITAFINGLPPEQALRETVEVNGLHFIRNENVVWVLTREEFYEDRDLGRERRVIHLQRARTVDVVPVLEKQLSEQGNLIAYPATNVLVIADSPARLLAIAALATALDQTLEHQVHALQHAAAATMAELLRPYATRPENVQPDVRTNQIVLCDTAPVLAELGQLIRQFDCPDQIFSRTFTLTYATANEVAKVLRELLSGSNAAASPQAPNNTPSPSPSPSPEPGAGAPTAGAPPVLVAAVAPARASAAQASAAQASQSLGPLANVVADPRTNSVVVTHTGPMLKRVEEIIRDLDVPTNYHVFQFQNADPTALGLEDKLKALLPGDEQYFSVDPISKKVAWRSGEAQANELIGLFEQWDAVVQQVQIEAEILSVNASLLRQLGISWQAVIEDVENGLNPFVYRDLDAHMSFPPDIPAAGPQGGLTIGNLRASDYEATIRALASDADTKVLARPHILVRNNESAVFSSVRNEPYKEIVVDGNTQTTLENVRFLDVGVRLIVKPVINEQNLIVMQVELEISNLVDIRSGIPVVDRSSAVSVVSIQNGEMLVLGGLRQQARRSVENGVPGLRKLPVLGNLFRNQKNDNVESEIVLVLRPVVMGSRRDEPLSTSDLTQRVDDALDQPLLMP
jgi:type II secretory pathway component GspD/PulD (secretin)